MPLDKDQDLFLHFIFLPRFRGSGLESVPWEKMAQEVLRWDCKGNTEVVIFRLYMYIHLIYIYTHEYIYIYRFIYIYIHTVISRSTWQSAAMVHDNDAIQPVLKGNLVSILHCKDAYIYPRGGRFTGNSGPVGVYIYEVTTWLMLRK